MFDENFGKGAELIVEQKVPMRRELSTLVARSPFGQGAARPVVERCSARTVRGGAGTGTRLSVGGGRGPAAVAAAGGELGVVGVMAMELFETVGEDGLA